MTWRLLHLTSMRLFVSLLTHHFKWESNAELERKLNICELHSSSQCYLNSQESAHTQSLHHWQLITVSAAVVADMRQRQLLMRCRASQGREGGRYVIIGVMRSGVKPQPVITASLMRSRTDILCLVLLDIIDSNLTLLNHTVDCILTVVTPADLLTYLCSCVLCFTWSYIIFGFIWSHMHITNSKIGSLNSGLQ